MNIYAALPDLPSALKVLDQLLAQRLPLEKISLLSSQPGLRADSLQIPDFGSVWGLGELSQASVLAAGCSLEGTAGLGQAVGDLPPGLARRLLAGFHNGEALMQVFTEDQLEQIAISALLSAHGARLLN